MDLIDALSSEDLNQHGSGSVCVLCAFSTRLSRRWSDRDQRLRGVIRPNRRDLVRVGTFTVKRHSPLGSMPSSFG